MSTIRRQSIISSFVVYIGFALGFVNTYLFTRQGGFKPEQFGLTAIFVAVSQLMYAVAGLGMPAYILKFFPYYKAHLPDKKNDQLTIALLLPCAGFILVILLGYVFKGPLISKIFNNSPELLEYYWWLFPFGLGYTLFMVLDIYAWQLQKAVMSNLLKEVVFRAMVTLLILLTIIGVIRQFSTFIGLYSMAYLALIIFLFVYFGKNRQLHFTTKISRVTRRFKKLIIRQISFVWGGTMIFSLASMIDTIFIAAILPNGVRAAGLFTFGQYIASLIQAPQRAVVSASTGALSQAWRDKDYGRIGRIYRRSSINQLLFSCAMFALIWINFDDGINTFHLQKTYLDAKWVFLFFGLTRVIDMGTGVSSQIISTSSFWRFDFLTGLVLLGLMLPLNFFLTRELGVIGPAISNLVSFAIFNSIRYIFLYRKFGMQPFDTKTIYTLLLTAACFALAYFSFRNVSGFHWMILRSLVFTIPFAAFTVWLNLSDDVLPVWESVKKRLGLTK